MDERHLTTYRAILDRATHAPLRILNPSDLRRRFRRALRAAAIAQWRYDRASSVSSDFDGLDDNRAWGDLYPLRRSNDASAAPRDGLPR